MQDGYAGTSMEAVAAAAGVSKRTLYKRYSDKATLLLAAIDVLIQRWLPRFEHATDGRDSLQTALLNAARTILDVALTPEALALHRIMIGESGRFPELHQVMQQAGANRGIMRLADLLGCSTWAAEQFQRLVLTGPQQRALGLGTALTREEREIWAQKSVALFLEGYAGAHSKRGLF